MKDANRPEIVTLCGSTRFKKEFIEMTQKLSLDGKIVLSVGMYSHADNVDISEKEKLILDNLHFRKIDISDSVFVIDVDGYIGESTRNEINYAKKIGKKINYYSNKLGVKNESN